MRVGRVAGATGVLLVTGSVDNDGVVKGSWKKERAVSDRVYFVDSSIPVVIGYSTSTGAAGD